MTLRDQWQTLKQNRPLAQLSIAYLIANIADAAFAGMLIYFVTVVAKQSPAVMGVLYPLGAVTSVLMTPVWAKLGARFGKREACIAAYVGLGLCWLALLVLPAAAVVVVISADDRVRVLQCRRTVAAQRDGAGHGGIRRDDQRRASRRTIYGAWVFVQQTGMALRQLPGRRAAIDDWIQKASRVGR